MATSTCKTPVRAVQARRRRVLLVLSTAFAVGAVAGCTDTSSGGADPTRAMTAQSSSAGAPPDTSNPGGLTGFGATQAYWDQVRKQDPNYPGGVVYQPDGSINTDGDGAPDRYIEVTTTDSGRVASYTMNFPVDTPAAKAESLAIAELPSDRRLVWRREQPTCIQQVWSSARLAAVLGPDLPDGAVLIQLENFDPALGDYSRDLGSVTEAIFLGSIWPKPEDAGDC